MVVLFVLIGAACEDSGIGSPVSLSVTPGQPSLAKGTTQQLVATGSYSDGSTEDLTHAVTWAVTDGAAATVSSSGLATGASIGSSTISASYLTLAGAAVLTVTAATPVSLSVTPSSPSIPKGTTQQLVATVTLTDGSVQDVSDQATWSSSDDAATVSATGLATGEGVGQATLSARYLEVSAAANLTVTDAVVTAVTVTPGSPSIAKGTARQFMATATFSDSTTQDVTALASWTAADVAPATGVATLSAAGRATGNSVGGSTVTADFMGSSGSTTLTVTAAVVTQIVVAPAAASIAKGTAQKFTATATLSDATTQDVTDTVLWKTTDVTGTDVASIDTSGKATGKNVGGSTVKADYLGLSSSATLTVTAAVPTSIQITPNPLNLPVGMLVQLTATLVYSDGTTQDVTATASWESASTATATVTALGAIGGRTRGVAAGMVVIKATTKGLTGQLTANVSSCYVSINELQAEGAAGTADEWVELYNRCPFAVDLINSKLMYRSASGSTDTPVFDFTTSTIIPAGGFLLYAGASYPAGSTKDGVLGGGATGAIPRTGGGLGLIYPLSYTGGASNLIVDSLGWGTATNIYVEGTVAAAPAVAGSLQRRPNGTDTNKNSADFTTTTLPTPRASN